MQEQHLSQIHPINKQHETLPSPQTSGIPNTKDLQRNCSPNNVNNITAISSTTFENSCYSLNKTEINNSVSNNNHPLSTNMSNCALNKKHNSTKWSDESREYKELNKEIYQIIQQGGNISNISGTSKNNTSNNSVGGVTITINDKTWVKKSTPDTNDSFERKWNELKINKNKKYAFIPNPKRQNNAHDFKEFNEFKSINISNMNQGNRSNSSGIDEVSDEIPNITEKINQWHTQEVKTNNLSEWDNNQFTGKNSSQTVLKNHNQNFVPKAQFTQTQPNAQIRPNQTKEYPTSHITNYFYPSPGPTPNYVYRMGNPFYNVSNIIAQPTNNQNTIFNKNINYLPPNPFGSISSSITATMSKTKNKKKLKDKFDQTLFTIDLEQIILGKDTRTTVMIRHIPNKYNSFVLREEIDFACQGKYDFFYLPIDGENNCNLGYAFINFTNPFHIWYFYYVFKSRKWNLFQSNKECDLSFAKFQGKVEWTAHLEKYMNKIEDETKMPIVLNANNLKKDVHIPKEYYQNIAGWRPDLIGSVQFI